MYIHTYTRSHGDIIFKDSVQFMASSLEKLGGNLLPEQFRQTQRYWEVRESGGPRYDTTNYCDCNSEPARKRGKFKIIFLINLYFL